MYSGPMCYLIFHLTNIGKQEIMVGHSVYIHKLVIIIKILACQDSQPTE